MSDNGAFTVPPLDEAAQRAIRKEAAARHRLNMMAPAAAAAQSVVPDDYALAKQLAAKTGSTTQAAAAAVKVDRKKALLANEDLFGIARDKPRLAGWLAKPDNFALSSDDMKGLVAMHDALADHRGFFGTLADVSGAAEGQHELNAGMPALAALAGFGDPAWIASTIATNERARRAAFARAPRDAQEFSEQLTHGDVVGMLSDPVGSAMGLFHEFGKMAPSLAEVIIPAGVVGGLVEAPVGAAIGSLIPGGGTLLGGAAGAIKGSTVGTVAGFTLTGAASRALQALSEEEVDIASEDSLMAAFRDPGLMSRVNGKVWGPSGASAAVMVGLMHWMPPGAAMVGTKGLASKAVGVGEEVVNQAATQLGSVIAGDIAAGKQTTTEGAVSALVQGAAFAPVGMAPEALAALRTRAAQGIASGERLKASLKATEGAAIFRRDLGATGDLARVSARGGPAETLYIDVDAFERAMTQEGKSPIVEATKLAGGDAGAFAEAKRAGFLAVNVGDYHARLAGTKAGEMLAEHTRVGSDGLTFAESQAVLDAINKQAQEAAEEAETAPDVDAQPSVVAAQAEARASQLEAEMAIPAGESRLWQTDEGPSPLEKAAEAIEAVPEGSLAAGLAGKLTGKGDVAKAVSKALKPVLGADAEAVARAAQRSPKAAAAKLRELAGIRKSQPKSEVYTRVREMVLGAGFKAKQADAIARVHEAFAATLERHGVKGAEKVVLGAIERATAPKEGDLQQPKKGAYSPWTRLIQVFEKGDESTLIHESAHAFADQIEALPELSSLRQEMYAALGVEKLDEASHERLAKEFEGYFLRGETPSPALRRVLAFLKDALLKVYTALDRRVSPELAAVFDRWLATDAEIAKAQSERGPMLTLSPEDAKAAGIPTEVYEALRKDAAAAGEVEREKLAKALLRDLKANTAAERTATLDKLREEEAAKLAETPAGKALAAMKEGDIKLSREAVKDQYGKEVLDKLEEMGVVSDDGLPPRDAAEAFGAPSEAELLRDLFLAADPRTVDASARSRLAREHPELYRDVEARKGEARKIVSEGEGRSKIADAELRALKDAARQAERETAAREKGRREGSEPVKELTDEVRALRREVAAGAAAGAMEADIRRTAFEAIPTLKDAGAYAQARINSMPVRDIKPRPYLAAAGRFATLAKNMAGEAKPLLTAQAIGKELVNRELFRVATNAQKAAVGALKRFTVLTNDTAQERLGRAGGGHMEQMNALLERHGLKEPVAGAPPRTESLAAYLLRMQDSDTPIHAPDWLVDERLSTNWDSLTPPQLKALRDLADAIYHVALEQDKFLTAQRFETIGAARKAVAEQIASSKPLRKKDAYAGSEAEDAAILAADLLADGAVTSITTRIMDGLQSGGVVTDTIVRPLNTASDVYAETNRLGHLAYRDLWKAHYTPKEMRTMDKREGFAGERLSRRQRLNMLGLAGRAEGWQRLQDRFSPETLDLVFRSFTGSDLAFVADRWAFWDPYFKEAQAQRLKATGQLVPESERRTFSVRTLDGEVHELGGGYHKIDYEDLQSIRAAAKWDSLVKHGLPATAMLETGFLKPVTEEQTGRKVRVDEGVNINHLNDITHTNAFYMPVRDVVAVLNGHEVGKAIQEHWGKATYKAMKHWVERVAGGNVAGRTGTEKFTEYLRGGGVTARLAFRTVSALRQLYGMRLIPLRSGYRNTWDAVSFWLTQGIFKVPEMIREKSRLMREREHGTWQRELNEARNGVARSLRTATTEMGFWMLSRMQYVVDQVAWLAEYRKAMKEAPAGVDPMVWDIEAVARADQAVRDTQGGGQPVDLSNWTGGGPLAKMLTTFGTDMSLKFNFTRQSWARTKFNDPVSWGRLMADMGIIYALPAVIGAGVIDAMFGDNEEPTEERVIRRGLAEIADIAPWVREFSGVIQGYDYRGFAGAIPVQAGVQMVQQIGQGEADAALWRSVNLFSGSLLWYPASTINELAGAAEQVFDGEVPWALVGVRAKK